MIARITGKDMLDVSEWRLARLIFEDQSITFSSENLANERVTHFYSSSHITRNLLQRNNNRFTISINCCSRLPSESDNYHLRLDLGFLMPPEGGTQS